MHRPVGAMSERWQRVDGLTRDLALAVELTDGVTGGRPVGEPSVRVEASDAEPYRNRSGYYLFFDLPEETVTVLVDGGDRYRDATISVDLGAEDFDVGEAASLTLEPTPAYQFPTGLTLARGTVLDGEVPVADATVSVADHDRTVTTTAAGEYVYYFDEVSGDDIERVDPEPDDDTNVVTRYYKPDGAHPTFHVDGSPGTFDQDVKVEVGQATVQNLRYPDD